MEYKALQFKADSVDREERIISGYASTWDVDQGDDKILRGAFAETLSSKASRVKVLWQHDSGTPIGKPRVMREDDRGLYTESYIARTSKGDEALELAKEGIVDSMSIGFTLSADDVEMDEDGVRMIRKINLMEYSLVTWAMNEAAVITAVKSVRPKEIERVLREAGIAKPQAKAIAAAGYRALREADDDATVDQVADAIKSFTSLARGLRS